MRKAVIAAGLGTALSAVVALPAGGAPPAVKSQVLDSKFQKVTLNDEPGEPMGLAVLPDLRVLHTDRTGEIRLHNPRTGLNTLAAELEVYQHDEEGVQSIAIDPAFKRNRWVYVYYSPPQNTPVDNPATPDVNEGDAPFSSTDPTVWDKFKGVVRLSRFKMSLRRGKLRKRTEQKIIDVPVDRGICCHVGGHIDFDRAGNLYLSTGDDTNPFESEGYTPIDERSDRHPAFDAQRTSANTNDLRGKVLRIKPRKRRGGYKIPRGNLFKKGKARRRAEIYLMGLRNPFRIAVNRTNNELYVADYSPDATDPDPQRGPAGQGKWFVARKAGNYGWPYCATRRLAYHDWDFQTETSRGKFNCRRPVNTSRHNTGVRRLPTVLQPDVWYTYAQSKRFPELEEGGIGPMAGPAYDWERRNRARNRWPRFFDGKPIFYEWTRDYLKEFVLGKRGRLFDINPLLDSFVFNNPMDLEFGPDGALYTLEYGDGFFLESPDAQLARIDYVRGGRTPIPKVSATPTNGPTPLTVSFSSAGTSDPDGGRLRYQWDFDADGRFDSTEQNPTHTYTRSGVYDATLKVTDRTLRSASAAVKIIVGNERPNVEFVRPVAGQPFRFGDTVQYEVRVTDDQPVDCTKVQVSYVLGHDTHGHPVSSTTGCTGSFVTTAAGHNPETDNISAVFAATYEDEGPTRDGNGSLEGNDEVVLRQTP